MAAIREGDGGKNAGPQPANIRHCQHSQAHEPCDPVTRVKAGKVEECGLLTSVAALAGKVGTTLPLVTPRVHHDEGMLMLGELALAMDAVIIKATR